MKKKVFVGLSGGVDSSVAATLLKKEGYDVTGVFIKVWAPDWLPCTWKDERRDAMKVAAHLDIPFLTFDFEKEYKEGIVDYMINEYKTGKVPNPDVMCNKEIKFGVFLNKALEMGADFIATGHYVRLKKHSLFKGVDKNKDQSYFLWTLNQKQLKHCLFPIGEYEKTEVRKMAEKFGLPTASKKDSQGLCFVGKIDMKEFLRHYIKEKKGNVINEEGEVIGEHAGAFFYTIGQRHGFTITEKGIKEKPYYVVNKDMNTNEITVSHRSREKDFARKEISLRDVNWISNISIDNDIEAKIRYRQNMQKCSVNVDNSIVKVLFNEPQNIASGQSLVLYKGEKCIGGGIIG